MGLSKASPPGGRRGPVRVPSRSRPKTSRVPSALEPSPGSGNLEVFDAVTFLASEGAAKGIVEYRRGEVIFRQGDPCEGVLYIRKGRVRLSVLSKTGKQAVVAVLGPGDFFGEGGLAGQPVRMASATAATEAVILSVDQDEMIRLLHTEHAMSDRLISHLLTRSIQIEEDLIDQLFSSSEKRLARKLLQLAYYGGFQGEEQVIPSVTQETLAEWIGTTRSRVNAFMKKFERLGFIDQTQGLKVHKSLMTVILHD